MPPQLQSLLAELEETTAALRHRWGTPSAPTLAGRRASLVARLASLPPSPELLDVFERVRQMDAGLERFLRAERAQILAQQSESNQNRQRVKIWQGALVEEANQQAARITLEG